MGYFPLMTETGPSSSMAPTRHSQPLVRSPGVYYNATVDPSGKKIYGTTVNKSGAWIESNIHDVVYARVDRTRKLPATVLLRALGLSSNEEIFSAFNAHQAVQATLEKDTTTGTEEALIEIYKKLRPGEPPTAENARQLIENTFFDSKRFDLACRR
jgi:DNA-directed RNA polymerase subunit beta